MSRGSMIGGGELLRFPILAARCSYRRYVRYSLLDARYSFGVRSRKPLRAMPYWRYHYAISKIDGSVPWTSRSIATSCSASETQGGRTAEGVPPPPQFEVPPDPPPSIVPFADAHGTCLESLMRFEILCFSLQSKHRTGNNDAFIILRTMTDESRNNSYCDVYL